MAVFNQSESDIDLDELESIHGTDDEEQRENRGLTNVKGKKPHRYTDSEDIAILKEVLMERVPRKGGAEKWKKIFAAVNIPVKDYRAIKTRFDVLYNCFIKDENTAFRGSGLEEDYDEKIRLMTDIVSQLDDWTEDAAKSFREKKKKDDSSAKAQKIREASLKTLKDPSSQFDDDATTPKRKRLSQNSADLVEMIKQAEENERDNKKALIVLETKRLEMMEKDFKLREENDIHRREMERRQIDLEEKRMDMESRRMEIENHRIQKETEERALLFQLLQKKN